jgi:HSP20 family protein
MNLPVLREKSPLSLSSFFDNDSLFDRLFDDFDRFFGTNCYTDESGDCIYQLEVPGYNKDNINVELSDGVLTIKGDREVKDKNYVGHSKIHKRLSVGGDVSDAEANVQDGILTIRLKYPEPAPGKQIEVK